jgi:endonuclease/exonuclease/phosphatase family metal-dependent hydrolase
MKDISSGHPELTVMTLNVYFGVELDPVFAARDFPELIAAVTKIWTDVQSTDIPARAAVLAREIAAAAPDLLGLQEIALWSTGAPGALSPKCDFLLLILEALQKEGVFYTPIAIAKDLDATGPLDMSGNLLRFEDRHAVLLRVDPNPTAVRPYSIQTQTFSTLFEIASPVMGSLKVPRSWVTIDAMLGGKKFRFVETHIESMVEAVQAAQNQELMAAATDTALPIIVVGDFNSNANQDPAVPDNTPTYPALIAGGFQDSWTVNPGDPGNTCCHDPNLRNVLARFNRRIDLILTRGAIEPIWAKLVGVGPEARTSSGVWPTDHAGVLARLRLR